MLFAFYWLEVWLFVGKLELCCVFRVAFGKFLRKKSIRGRDKFETNFNSLPKVERILLQHGGFSIVGRILQLNGFPLMLKLHVDVYEESEMEFISLIHSI